MRTTEWRKITGSVVNRVSGTDGTHGHRQPSPRRLGEVGGGGGDDADAEPRRQSSERGVALVVERMAVPAQLDADPFSAEPVHQVRERLLCSFRPSGRERLADMTFATAGQDVPVATRRLGQRVVVIAQDTLLPT